MSEVVLFDKASYTAKPPWTGTRPEAVTLVRGTVIESSTFSDSLIGRDRELKRLRDLGAIGEEKVLAAMVEAAAGPVDLQTTALSDAEIGKLDVAETAALVGQFPAELDRVLRLETAKGARARKGVLALHPDYHDDGTGTGDGTGETLAGTGGEQTPPA